MPFAGEVFLYCSLPFSIAELCACCYPRERPPKRKVLRHGRAHWWGWYSGAKVGIIGQTTSAAHCLKVLRLSKAYEIFWNSVFLLKHLKLWSVLSSLTSFFRYIILGGSFDDFSSGNLASLWLGAGLLLTALSLSLSPLLLWLYCLLQAALPGKWHGYWAHYPWRI